MSTETTVKPKAATGFIYTESMTDVGIITERKFAVRDAINRALHEAQGVEPCESACTHVVVAGWTALGIANAVARRDIGID